METKWWRQIIRNKRKVGHHGNFLTLPPCLLKSTAGIRILQWKAWPIVPLKVNCKQELQLFNNSVRYPFSCLLLWSSLLGDTEPTNLTTQLKNLTTRRATFVILFSHHNSHWEMPNPAHYTNTKLVIRIIASTLFKLHRLRYCERTG